MPLRVRDATAADAGAIAAVYRPYVDESVASFEESAPDAAEIASRMSAAPGLPWLVAEDADVVGFAYAARHRSRAAYRWSVDCSVYLDRGHQARGIGRALYAVLLPLLRELGYFRAFAGIALPNPASVRLHEAMGFVPVGVYELVGYKHGAWRDVGWWQLALRSADEVDAPAEPRTWIPRT